MTTTIRRSNVKVTRDEFYKVVTDRRGCTFLGMYARYIPDHFEFIRGRQVFPWYNNIYCYSRITCMTGIDYQNSVNNALERQGKERNFERSGEPWGPNFKHENDAAVIHNVNDGRRYLQVKVTKREYDYRRMDNHHRIPIEQLIPWMDEVQNTEGVVLRRYRFDHLLWVNMKQASEDESKHYVLV